MSMTRRDFLGLTGGPGSGTALGGLLASVAFCVACSSPEANRTFGGAAGADTGNRHDPMLMHAGARPYHGTPTLIPAAPPALEGAEHAHALSR